MLSEDYKDRFKAEYMQLYNRFKGLCKMLKIGIMEVQFYSNLSQRTLYLSSRNYEKNIQIFQLLELKN